MLLIVRSLIFILLLSSLSLFFFLGEKQSSNVIQVYNLWYQNFKENIFLSRDEALIKNIDTINIKKKFYHYNNNLAYYNNGGELNLQVFPENDYNFSASENYYILYQKAGEAIELYSNTGEKKWSLNTFSYPHLSPLNNLLLLLSTDSAFITFYDVNKNILLEKSYLGSLITDFEFSQFDGSIIFGTLDGKIFFYNYQGELEFENRLQSSKINYVKTVGASPLGNYLLAIHGLKPEFLSLFDKTGNLLWSNNTQVERRKKTFPYIDEEKNEVYDLRNKSIYILNLENGEVKGVIDLDFPELTIDYSLIKTNGEYLAVALNSADRRVFLLFDKNYEIVWQKEFSDAFFLYLEVEAIRDNNFEILFHTNKGIYLYQVKIPIG